jgi:hypothetical protein
MKNIYLGYFKIYQPKATGGGFLNGFYHRRLDD